MDRRNPPGKHKPPLSRPAVAPQIRGEGADLCIGRRLGGNGGQNYGLEFILCTESADVRAVELLAMSVYYNRNGSLGLGHTLPSMNRGCPGRCADHLLVSLPYPFGPDLETCHVGDRPVQFLWLLPVSGAERDLKVSSGLEALESRFEEVGLRYWQVDRASVV